MDTNIQNTALAPIQGQVAITPVAKPWFKSQTVIFAGIAGAAACLGGGLTEGLIMLPDPWNNYVGLVLNVITLVASGGAIHGRFVAHTFIK